MFRISKSVIFTKTLCKTMCSWTLYSTCTNQILKLEISTNNVMQYSVFKDILSLSHNNHIAYNHYCAVCVNFTTTQLFVSNNDSNQLRGTIILLELNTDVFNCNCIIFTPVDGMKLLLYFVT